MLTFLSCLLYCAILVFNQWNTANSLSLYIVKTDACVKCNYTVRECLLLPHDAAMLARSWELWFCLFVHPSVTRVLYCVVTNPKNLPAIFLYYILITANMQSKMGFPSSHQLKSYVAPKSAWNSRRAVLSAHAGLFVDKFIEIHYTVSI